MCLIYAASALVWYDLNKEVDVAFGKTCDDRFPSVWSSGEAQTPSPVTLSLPSSFTASVQALDAALSAALPGKHAESPA